MTGSGEFIPEAERQFVVAGDTKCDESGLFDDIRDQWASRLSDERGMVSPVDLVHGATAVKASRRVARRMRGGNGDHAPEAPAPHRLRKAIKWCGSLGVCAGLLSMCGANQGESSVDWHDAYVAANVRQIVWDHNTEITTGEIAFYEDMVAENIEWDINSSHTVAGFIHIPDLYNHHLDPKVNRELVGNGQEILGVPLAALTEYDYRGKVYYKVDMSKLDGKISMSGGGPQYIPFIVKGQKVDPSDPEGFRDSALHAVAGVASLLGGNLMQNIIDNEEAATRQDETIAWLKAMGACNHDPGFITEAKKQITQSLVELEAKQPHPKPVGHVLFVNQNIPFKTDTGQLASKLVGNPKQAQIKFAAPKPDVLSCGKSTESTVK